MTLAGGDSQRDSGGKTQSPSPSPTRPWRQVTFKDLESTSEEDHPMRQQVGWFPHNRRPAEYNLGPPPTLEPNIEHCLGEPTATQEAEGV